MVADLTASRRRRPSKRPAGECRAGVRGQVRLGFRGEASRAEPLGGQASVGKQATILSPAMRSNPHSSIGWVVNQALLSSSVSVRVARQSCVYGNVAPENSKVRDVGFALVVGFERCLVLQDVCRRPILDVDCIVACSA